MSQRTESKHCSKCREVKALDAFHRAKNQPLGRHPQCKDCRSELGKAERAVRGTRQAERMALFSEGLQQCSTCAEVKALDAFYRSSRSKTGRKSECIPCYKAKGSEYREREGVSERYRRRHIERRLKDPVKYYKESRDNQLRHKYGIDSGDYDAMLESQSGRCGICASRPDGYQLYVDHCHKTGAVRGLLCRKCNSGIGMLGDTHESVRRALEYLEKAERPAAGKKAA